MCVVVVEYLETGSGENERLTALESAKVSQENIRTVFSGMCTILSAALKQPSLKTEVSEDVTICSKLFYVTIFTSSFN